MLEIKNLTKSYDNLKKAVDDISITIENGEIFGFIGHNGAGKTTTIKSCVGLISFDSGEILFDGKSIKDDPIDCKKSFAYIPDNPILYEQLSAIAYLNFIADVFNMPKDVREKQIAYYSRMFELENNLNDIISSYSHGMKQRLALISAFIRSPKTLILDEPFVGLDPSATFKVKEEMRKLCQNGGCVFFSTHILEVAEKLCDKIAIIKNGKIIVSGTVEEVKGNKTLEDVFLELE